MQSGLTICRTWIFTSLYMQSKHAECYIIKLLFVKKVKQETSVQKKRNLFGYCTVKNNKKKNK